MNNLPLEEVANIYSGNSINAKLKKEKYTDKNFSTPYVATKDLSKNGDFDYNNGVTIPDIELDNFKIAPKGSTLICMEGGSAGKKIGLVKQNVCFVNKLGALVPNEKIDNKYLYYSLQTPEFQAQFKSSLTGIIGGISLSKLKKLRIPVPPIQEQEKIVERLDKVSNTTSTIDSINEKKKDLFELLNKSFYEGLFEDMKRFPSTELIEVCNLITDGSHFSPKKFSDEYPYITVKDIDNYGNIDFVNCKKIDKELYLKMKSNNCNPVFGDILFSKDGTIGKTSLIDNENEFVVLSSLAIIRPNQTKINKNFLFNLVSSPKFIELCVAKKTGVAIQRIILKNLKTVNLPLPPLEIQEELNIKIEKFKKYLQTLEDNLNITQIKKDEFKKSFVQKEFSYE